MDKTLFFNIEALNKYAKGDLVKLFDTLRKYKDRRILQPLLDAKLHGSSYLLKPSLLLNSKEDILFKYQYLVLAAKRDYTLYQYYSVKHLLLSFYPDLLHINVLKNNPLLTVTNTEIHFKYEE